MSSLLVQDGAIVIVNGTDLPLKLSDLNSHQMKEWNKNFPETILPFSVAKVSVEFDHEVGILDKPADTGNATYSAPNGDFSFRIHAGFRDDPKIPGTTTPSITVTTTVGNHTYKDELGWERGGKMGFVVAGQSPHYFIHNSVSGESWMSTLLPLFGDRCLRDITLPGSHDAGISEINSNTAFSDAYNTQTQKLIIHDQLMRGSRYFDIRPIIGGGQYWTGHYGKILDGASFQGARGQSIDAVIRDINNFTASHNELIILNLSHDLNTDVGNGSYRKFTTAEYQGLLQLLLSRLNYLYAAKTGTDVTLIPLNQLISKHSAVIVFVEASDKVLRQGDSTYDYTKRGFYRLKGSIGQHKSNDGAMKTLPSTTSIPSEPPEVSVYDHYSDTEDLSYMMKDQISKMQNFSFTGGDCLFLLSWTLTLGKFYSTVDATRLDFKSIEDLATAANRRIYDKILPMVAYGHRPNIVFLDYYSYNAFTALVVAINLKVLKGES